MTDHGEDLRQLAQRPFALISALDARYGSTRLRSQAREGVYGAADSWPGLTLKLAGVALTVPQHDVREVREAPAFTRVPRTQPWLLGLANVRGDLLAVVDLQQLLLGQAGVLGLDSRLLVFNHPELPVGFLVDKVEGMRRFSVDEQRHERIEEAPAALQPWLLGAFQRGDDLRWILSLHKLAQAPHFMSAAA